MCDLIEQLEQALKQCVDDLINGDSLGLPNDTGLEVQGVELLTPEDIIIPSPEELTLPAIKD